jgi:hypothetical protein
MLLFYFSPQLLNAWSPLGPNVLFASNPGQMFNLQPVQPVQPVHLPGPVPSGYGHLHQGLRHAFAPGCRTPNWGDNKTATSSFAQEFIL